MNGPVGDEPIGELELVHTFDGPMPTGVTVSHTGRIFVNYPKWGDEVPATVAELRDGGEVAYPDQAWNDPSGDDDAERLRLGAERRGRPGRPALGAGHRQPDVRARPSRAARSWSASTWTPTRSPR